MTDKNKSKILMDRRQILEAASIMGLTMLAPGAVKGQTPDGESPVPSGEKPSVVMLVYPKMVLMDLVGPMTVMKILGANIHLVWKDTAAVSTDVGIPIAATTSFSECPKNPDVLFVPGGIMGTIDCMHDQDVCDFLATTGENSRYVTSVCTGSLVLAAAGLLVGYKATSHWGVADLLPLMGSINTNERVVQDGNRITGGGVTAGLDFGLTLASLLTNEEEARRIQLILEYSPEPPFLNGTPEEAGPRRLKEARDGRVWMDAQALAASEAAAQRLTITL